MTKRRKYFEYGMLAVLLSLLLVLLRFVLLVVDAGFNVNSLFDYDASNLIATFLKAEHILMLVASLLQLRTLYTVLGVALLMILIIKYIKKHPCDLSAKLSVASLVLLAAFDFLCSVLYGAIPFLVQIGTLLQGFQEAVPYNNSRELLSMMTPIHDTLKPLMLDFRGIAAGVVLVLSILVLLIATLSKIKALRNQE